MGITYMPVRNGLDATVMLPPSVLKMGLWHVHAQEKQSLKFFKKIDVTYNRNTIIRLAEGVSC